MVRLTLAQYLLFVCFLVLATSDAFKLRWECKICERAWPTVLQRGIGSLHASNICGNAGSYSTDVNPHLCLMFEDGKCKRYMERSAGGPGWAGHLPNPFDWAFKVFTPGRHTYVHGVASSNRIPAGPIRDRWCPNIIQDMKSSPNLAQILSSGCSASHGPDKWYERSCSAYTACRCLVNKRDNRPFCMDGGLAVTQCQGSGNPGKYPAGTPPHTRGRTAAGRGAGAGGRGGAGGGGGGSGGGGGGGAGGGGGGGGASPTPGIKDPYKWNQIMWNKRPKQGKGQGRGGFYTKQIAALKENAEKAKGEMLGWGQGAGDQFNPDTQPKCGPKDPDCSPPSPPMTHASGTTVPP